MRYHLEFPAFDLWTDADDLRAFVSPANLLAARLEPIMHRRLGAAILDLTFARGERRLIVPTIRIDTGMLLEREDSPLVWPRSIFQSILDTRLDLVNEFLLPWLWSRSRARSLNAEVIRVFDEGFRAEFEAARERMALGATRYHDVAKAIAPYWYAARFATGRRGLLAGRGAALGWRTLRKTARSVEVMAGAWYPSAEQRWFDGPVGLEPSGDYDFAVVDAGGRAALGARLANIPDVIDIDEAAGNRVSLAWPVPTDLLVAFDPAEAPAACSFSVRAGELPMRDEIACAAPEALGDSGGRIYFAMRADYRIAPDGDVDSALALADLLRAEGFGVDVGPPLHARDAAAYDLVHAFGLGDVESLEETLAAAEGARVPVVLSADFDDIADQRWWGEMIAPVAYHSRDEVELALRLDKFVRRELETEEYVASRRCAPLADFDERASAALQRVRAVYVQDAHGAAVLRERYALASEPIALGPFIAPAPPAGVAGWEAGTADYVFVHTPIVARSNAIALARAACRERLPLVIAGPVADVHHLERVREYGDERLVLMPEPTPGELARLYRSARVFADASWYGFSAARPLRAVLCGASLVVSALGTPARLLAAGVRTADPANEREIGARLREAWLAGGPSQEIRHRLARLCDPAANLRAVISGYARTAAAASNR